MDDDQPIETTPTTQSTSDPAMELMRLEDLIKRIIGDLEREQQQLKEKKSAFDDSFETDLAYSQAQEKLETAMRARNEVKERILQGESVVALQQEILGLRESIKDNKEALSDYLKKYQEETQANQIEVAEGDLREIVTSRRLVKPRDKK